jgi:hypothetical protein
MSSTVSSRRRKLAGLVQLVTSALLLGAFVPFISLPYGPSLSLFDLLSGSLSGGAWQPARLAVLFPFLAPLALLVSSALRLLKAKHETVA